MDEKYGFENPINAIGIDSTINGNGIDKISEPLDGWKS